MQPNLIKASLSLLALVTVFSVNELSLLRLRPGFLTSAAIAQTSDPRKEQASKLFNLGVQQFDTGQYDAANQSYQAALKLYRELGDRRGEGAILAEIGLTLFALGQYDLAEQHFQQSWAIAREVKDQGLESTVLNNLGNIYMDRGQIDRAIQSFQQSLTLSQAIKDRKGEGHALGSLANAYGRMGNHTKAIELLQKRLLIAREQKDRLNEGGALHNLAVAFGALGDPLKAIDYDQQSLTISQQIQNRRGETYALNSLSGFYRTVGDYAKAIEYNQKGLALARQIKNRYGEAFVLSNLGNLYSTLANYPKASEAYEQSLKIARAIQNRYLEGGILRNLGGFSLQQGDYAKAIAAYEQSLAIAREIKNRAEEGTALRRLGSAYSEAGDYGKAIAYQQQALKIAQEVKDPGDQAAALQSLGHTYLSQEQYDLALTQQQQALSLVRKIGDREEEGWVLNSLGLTLLRAGRYGTAEQALRDSIQVWEALRSSLGNDDSNKVSIFEQQARTYRTLQRVLIAQNKPAGALEISERGRARSFVELLSRRIATQATGQNTPPTIAAPTLQQIQQIAQQHNATLVEYTILYDEFKVNGREETQEAELLVWVVAPTGKVDLRRVDLTPLWRAQNTTLPQVVQASREAIGLSGRGRSGGRGTADPASSNSRLQQLHQLLIAPIAPLLPSDPNARVVFVPQGELFLVPFPALTDATGKALIEQHTILTAPSIQVLQLTRQQKKTNRSPVGNLIVGNPTMPKVAIVAGEEPEQLPDLPGAEAEAKAIAQLLKTEPLLGDAATKVSVVQKMSQARLVHLATHGLLDDFKGLGVPGAIALAPSGKDDGLLTASEILDLKLNADLVVLSACDTGRGKITGDGVIGLSRALVSAGVPSVIVSLWAVPDAPTAALMTQFYQNLQQNPDKAQALRQAMLTTRSQYPNPVNWAAFTLLGEAE